MLNLLYIFSSPPAIPVPFSSTGNSLAPEEAKRDDPSCALSSPAMEDTEVSSQRPSTGRGGAYETVRKAPEDNTLGVLERGTTIRTTIKGGGLQQSGPSPDAVPETSMIPGSDQHPSSKEGGGARSPSAASVNPEAADSMREALEAFHSLLTGFKVSSLIFFMSILYIYVCGDAPV